MWDETLAESRKSFFSFPIAVFVHAAVVAILIAASYWSVGAVPAPPEKRITIFVPKVLPSGGPQGAAIHQRTVIPSRPPIVIPVPEQSNIDATQAAPATNTLVTAPGNADVLSAGDGNGTSAGTGTGTWTGDGSGPYVLPDDQPETLRPEIIPPVLVKRIEPVYPPALLKAHMEGIVVLEAVISKTGEIKNIRVRRSPNPLLTEASITAVRQWRYKPAMFNNRPISVYFQVTVSYKIR